jgi:diguanylate cyclase (GGDEF)-like protein
MIGSERKEPGKARIAVLASDAAQHALVSALSLIPAAEVRPLAWPSQPPLAPTPDLVVCEIQDARQAFDRRRELETIWPGAFLVSCERGNGHHRAPGAGLSLASRQAGYHGHVLLDEAALHLPFFLRYAEQRRKAESQLARLESLLQAVTCIHASLDLQRVAGEILRELGRRVQADGWLLYIVSEDGRSLELALSEGIRTRLQSLTLDVGGPGLIERAVQEGEIAVSHQAEVVEIELLPEHKRTAGAVLCLPLVVEGQAVGVVQAFRNPESGLFDPLDEQMLRELSRVAAAALNNAVQFARTERLYMQDDLTRLYNSRYLRQFLGNEIKRARRYHSRVSVAFIDLDGFKQVNDRYGHLVGSETLKEVANLLADAVRETDVVARYGGDEFMIVLPETCAEKALATAERIRLRLAEHLFTGRSGQPFRLTASFGIAAYPDHAQLAADLIEKADLAMYQAKARNKNNVKLAE